MGDIFKEQLIAQKMSQKDKIQRIIIVVAAVLLGIIAFAVGGTFIGPVIIVGLVFGTAFLISKYKKEYEYSLTNNELDIDIIYNKERRKSLLTINLKQIDIMASIKDERHKASLERAQKTINASDGEHTEATYALIYPIEGVPTKILLTPNEEMRTLIYKQAPHKVFIKRF
ncbi:MAG: hypothetical protein ACRCW2_16505 [Cellulosilyticaceae bacterium]